MKRLYSFLIVLTIATTSWCQHDSVYYEITHLGKGVNSTGGESGGMIIGDSLFLYSTIRHVEEQRSWMIDFNPYVMKVFQAPISPFGKIGQGRPSPIGINSANLHNGNVFFDKGNNAIYFTRCQGEDNIKCEIFVTRFVDGAWQKPVKVPGEINQGGYTATQPALGHLPDGREILYFCSDRPGGVGGLDIWYTILEDGVSTTCINLGIPVNSESDENTPFYDDVDKCLYFSSNRPGGYGDADIYVSQGYRNNWHQPIHLPEPINGKYNDLYFTINPNDHNQGFFSSNRLESFFAQDTACCNDIYRWQRNTISIYDPEIPDQVPHDLQQVAIQRPSLTKIQKKARDIMPIMLYFHNDEPDPKSKLAVTKETYFQLYNKYMFMKHDYMDHSPINRVTDIENFFNEEIHDNCDKFEKFLKLLEDDLKQGNNVSITIAGYASTSHSSSYNFNLSKRRISSIINQIMTYDKGIMTSYLCSQNAGSLQITEVPYGNSQAVSSAKAPAYDIDAVRERRIEILDYTYLGADAMNRSELRLPLKPQSIGTFEQGGKYDIEVRLPNNINHPAYIDFLSAGTAAAIITGHSQLEPGKDLVLYMHIDARDAKESNSNLIPISIRLQGENVTQTIFLQYGITSRGK